MQGITCNAGTLPRADWLRGQGKTNFFERRVGEYQRAGVMGGAVSGNSERQAYVFTMDEDF